MDKYRLPLNDIGFESIEVLYGYLLLDGDRHQILITDKSISLIDKTVSETSPRNITVRRRISEDSTYET